MKIIISLILFTFSLSSFGSQEVKNYFINGVANTRVQTIESAKQMEGLAAAGQVGYLYNSTQNTALDFIEAGRMSLNLDGFYNQDGTVNKDHSTLDVLDSYFKSEHRNDGSDLALYRISRSYHDFLKSGNPEAFLKDISIELSSRWSIYGYYLYSRFRHKHEYSYLDYINLKRIHDLTRNADELIIAYGNYLNYQSLRGIAKGTREYLDINLMIETVFSDIESGYRINVISHSQGNLYANRLLDYIGLPGLVKLLSVATPDGKVYGYDPSGNGGYITLHEDLVSLVFFGALSKNGTNHPEEFWETIVSDFPIQRQIEICLLYTSPSPRD